MSDPLTGSLATVTEAIFDRLVTDQTILGVDEKFIFYGDQDNIPGTPCLCVEPDNKAQDYKGTGTSKYRQIFTIYVLVYHSAVTSPQSNRRDSDLLGEAVQKSIHRERTLGGIVVDAFVSNITSGYATKSQSIMRASRVQITAQSQTLIG